MVNKLKQYKFSPRTKEEMKAEFAFLFEENTDLEKKINDSDGTHSSSDGNSQEKDHSNASLNIEKN